MFDMRCFAVAVLVMFLSSTTTAYVAAVLQHTHITPNGSPSPLAVKLANLEAYSAAMAVAGTVDVRFAPHTAHNTQHTQQNAFADVGLWGLTDSRDTGSRAGPR